MKRTKLLRLLPILFASCLVASTDEIQAQVNLLSNPGWDDGPTTSVLVSGAFSTTILPNWQVYVLGGDPPGEVIYSAVNSPDAISAPHYMSMNVITTPGDAAVRKDNMLFADPREAPVIVGNYYTFGMWVRDIDGGNNGFQAGIALFDASIGFMGFARLVDFVADPSGEWEKIEVLFKVTNPAAAYGDYQFRFIGAPGEAHADDAFFIDVTKLNRVTNGGFENSPVRVLEWQLLSTGSDTTMTLNTDASNSSQSLRISQTSVGTEGGVRKLQIPWTGGNNIYLGFDAKDDPTLATGEHVQVVVEALDTLNTIVGTPISRVYPLSTIFKRFDEGRYDQPEVATPANATKLNITFRITDSNGVLIPGDILLDNVEVGDTSVYGLPVELSDITIE